MAFNTTNEGVPYYKSPAPEIPVPDSTAAKIISAGTQAGVMGFVHMAVAAQQAKLEQEQMLQKADLAAKELQHKDEWQQMDYEVAKENADTNQQYRKDWYDIQKQNAEDLKNYRSESLKLKLQAKIDADKFVSDYTMTQDANDMRATRAASELKLNDETYRNDHPVEWLTNLEDFKKRFGTAKVGAVPGLINAFDGQAKQMTVPFLPGAEYEQQVDPKTNQPILQNGKPTYAWNGVSKNQLPVQMPLRDVVRMWQDPVQRQAVEKGIIAGGHGHIVDQIQTTVGDGFLGFKPKKTVTQHVPTLDAYGNKILGAASKVKPSEARNQVDPVLQQSRPPQWMIKGGLGNTGGDDAAAAEAEHVKALISQHPDLAPQLKGTFYETYPDFDPTYLDSP